MKARKTSIIKIATALFALLFLTPAFAEPDRTLRRPRQGPQNSSWAALEPTQDGEFLIRDIAYSREFNSITLNMIHNYWSGEGRFQDKGQGLWIGDWMGDAGTFLADHFFAMALDPRLYEGKPAEERRRMRHALVSMAARTIDYSMYAAGKVMTWALCDATGLGCRTASRPTDGEVQAALAGYAGLGAGYEWMRKPAYMLVAPPRYQLPTVQARYHVAATILTVAANELLETRPEIFNGSGFTPVMGGGVIAYTALRLAGANARRPSGEKDLDMAAQALRVLDDTYWIEDQGQYASDIITWDNPAVIMALARSYQETGDEADRERAVRVGESIHEKAWDESRGTYSTALSCCAITGVAYLHLYEITGDEVYLERTKKILDFIMTELVVEDPYQPGYLIAAHDTYRAKQARDGNWPEFDPENPEWVACTGCNFLLGNLILQYDRYANQLPVTEEPAGGVDASGMNEPPRVSSHGGEWEDGSEMGEWGEWEEWGRSDEWGDSGKLGRSGEWGEWEG